MPYGIDSINPTSNKDSFFANPFQQPATIDHGNMDTSDDLMMAIQQDEAQFEQLKRKLESDRKDVADQLEKYMSGSETASLHSLSSSEDLWLRQPSNANIENEDFSDSNSNVIIESCLRTLEEKGVVNDEGSTPNPNIYASLPSRNKLNNTIKKNKYDNDEHESGWNFDIMTAPSSDMKGEINDRKLSNGIDHYDKIASSQLSMERSLIRSSYTSLPRSGINLIIPEGENSKRQPSSSRDTIPTLASPRKQKLSLTEGYSTLERQRQAASNYDSSSVDYESYPSRRYYHKQQSQPHLQQQQHDFHENANNSTSPQDIPLQSPSYEPSAISDRYITYKSDGLLPVQRSNSTYSNETEENLPSGPPSIKQMSRLNSERSSSEYQRISNFAYDSTSISSRGQSKYARGGRSKRSASQDGYGEGIPDYHTMPWTASRDSRNFMYDVNRRQSDQYTDHEQLSIESQGHIILVSDRSASGRRKNSTRSGDGGIGSHPTGTYGREDNYYAATMPNRDQRGNRPRIRGDDLFDSSGYISVAQRPSRQQSVNGRISSATSSVRSVGSSQKYSLTIEDAVNMLKSDNSIHSINAAVHLQHACFNNDGVKATIKRLGGILHLVRMVDSKNEEIQLSAIATLRNLAYGKANDESKGAILRHKGIPVLANVLRRTGSPHVREEIVRLLWNLSTLEAAKEQLLNLTLDVLAKLIEDHSISAGEGSLSDTQWPTIYANATGTLRNLSSSTNLSSRQMMRKLDHLINALITVTHLSVQRKDFDGKCVENSVCILRNLSYNLEEEVDHGLDIAEGYKKIKLKKRSVLGKIFNDRKTNLEAKSVILPENNRNIKGIAILWQTSTIEDYLAILQEGRNTDTIEAVVGAIHNLTACNWRFSGHIRYVVRREKGISILRDLMQFEDEKVFTAVVTALNNLALDEFNKDLIGDIALSKLIDRILGRNNQFTLTDISLCSLIKALCVLMYKNSKNANRLVDSGILPHLTVLSRKNSGRGRDVIKASNSLLFTLWQYKHIRSSIKKAKWDLKIMKTSLKEAAEVPDAIYIRAADIPDAESEEEVKNGDDHTMTRSGNANVANYATATLTKRSKLRSDEYPHESIPEDELTLQRIPSTQEEIEGSVFSGRKRASKSSVLTDPSQQGVDRLVSVGSHERNSLGDKKSTHSSDGGKSRHASRDFSQHSGVRTSRKSSSNSQNENVIYQHNGNTTSRQNSDQAKSTPRHSLNSKSKVLTDYNDNYNMDE